MNPDRQAHEDLLVHRLLEGLATPAEWGELESLATADPPVWRRVSRTLFEQGLIMQAVDGHADAASPAALPRHAPNPRRAAAGAAAWMGWAAAALLALGWSLDAAREGGRPTLVDGVALDGGAREGATRLPAADMAPFAGDATELDLAYVRGRVVSELPSLMLDGRRRDDGRGFEVLVLRRTVERVEVDDLLGQARDELGNPVAVPVTPAGLLPLENM